MQASKAGAEARRWWTRQLQGCRQLKLPAEADCMDAADPAAALKLCHMSDQGLKHLRSAAASLKTSNFIVMMAAFQVLTVTVVLACNRHQCDAIVCGKNVRLLLWTCW